MAVTGVYGETGIAGGGGSGVITLTLADPLPPNLRLTGNPTLAVTPSTTLPADSPRIASVAYVRDAITQFGGGLGGDTISTNMAATGASQITATNLTSQLNEVTSGTGGVRWDDPTPGDHRFIRNSTNAAIMFYPPTGGRINNLAQNSGIYIQPDTTAFIKAISAAPARLVTVP